MRADSAQNEQLPIKHIYNFKNGENFSHSWYPIIIPSSHGICQQRE